jgi:hypothetical protein
MYSKNLSLDFLYHTLEFWEDVNHYAEMRFGINLKFPKMKEDAMKLNLYPCEGSEISMNGTLSRSIAEYKNLRKILESGKPFDHIKLLPRVPKEFRNKFERAEEYICANNLDPLLLFPKFISNWLDSKKVCRIANPRKIEYIDPSVDNYLHHLPYSNFILSISEPLTTLLMANMAAKSEVATYSNYFVSKEGDELWMLAIPDGIENFSLGHAVRKQMIEIQNVSPSIKFEKLQRLVSAFQENVADWNEKTIAFTEVRANIKTGSVVVAINGELVDRFFAPDFATGNTDGPLSTAQNAVKMSKVNSLLFLNGVCKLLANYVPDEVQLIDVAAVPVNNLPTDPMMEQSKSNTEPISVTETQKWYEVALGNVTFITFKKGKSKTAEPYVHTGREMPFHTRRKHQRNYRNELGEIVKTITINEVKVRADKEQSGGNIHGSISTYE